MTKTSFVSKDIFLAELAVANNKIDELLGKINISLSEQGFPLKKDTYHFLTRVLQPVNRIERTLYMLLFETAYQSELLSAGSAYLSIRFANAFIKEITKLHNIQTINEVLLVKEFEKIADVYNHKLCALGQHISKKKLSEQILRICEDDVLAEAIEQAIQVAGLEGKIHVEDSVMNNYVVEQKSGYYFKAVSPYRFMLPANGVWEAKDAKVMLVDGVLEKVSELDKILNGAAQTKIPLLLMAHGFSEEIIATIKTNVDCNKFNIMPLKLTSDLESLNVINDIAVVSGANITSTLKGEMVYFVDFASLPIVENIRLTMSELAIENVNTRRAVSSHLRNLLEKRREQSNISDVSDLVDKRIQGLISAAVVLRLPSLSPSRREHTKVKIDNTLRTVKTLSNYGIVNLKEVVVDNPQSLLETAFWKAIQTLQSELTSVPTVSAYCGVYLTGKTILSLLTAGGLVQIIDRGP